MALTHKVIAVVGSREFKNFAQLRRIVLEFLEEDDWIVSGGAVGADSFAQRLRKEIGGTILIHYPKWRPDGVFDRGAGYKRNKKIADSADIVLCFYQKDHFQQGGTANTATWARTMKKELHEYEEE